MNPPTSRNATTLRSIAGLAAAGALVFTLGACGGNDDGGSAPEDQGPVSATTTTTAPADGGAASPTTTAASVPAATPPNAEARNAAALAAIATAESVAKGTAYEIDDEDDDQAWEVDVMVGDRSVEVKVSADGRTAQGQTDDDDADDDDKARLARAKTTLAQGIEAALKEVPGTLDDVDLDAENGVDVWQVSIDTAENDDVEVYVATDDLRIVSVDR